MNNLRTVALGLGLVALLAGGPVVAQEAVATMDQLLDDVRKRNTQRKRESDARIARFEREKQERERLLREAKTDLRNENARSDRLKEQFDANEKALADLEETLRIRVGDMGELFGVVRQVAGDTKGVIDGSMISAQYPDRGDVASRLAQTKGVPSIDDLHGLRVLLHEEMTESGRVVRFNSEIIRATGEADTAEVVRVGVFNAITGNSFLTYSAETGSLRELPRQPQDRFRNWANDLSNAPPGETVGMAVDPSRGALLASLIQRATPRERVDQGGGVGYTIIILGIIGLLIAVERFITLSLAGGKIKSQRNSLDAPDTGNALGRILNVYHENKDIDTETLELKLDESILRETAELEKRQSIIKIFAAVAPLLGLLGTVVGMIETFQQITLFGTGDPKLMAGGISQALVTTMLGLMVAIPLVLFHSFVSGRSKGLIEILEEQSAGMIARHSEQEEPL